MASVRVVEANHGAGSSQCPPLLPHWKLYHNPHYSPHHIIHHLSYSSRSPPQTKNLDSPMIVVPEDDGSGGEEVEVHQGVYGAAMSPSELELCVARIRDLRAELEFERRMRRKAEALSEALAAELADERRRREAAEAERRALREDAAAAREEAERALEDVEEERRMLRVAELWREERVQMKLADASQYGQESPSRSQQGHRREVGGGENPHIRRGIKGFVEFPKAVRVRPREERVDLVSNLECQRAQLRVLMRHRSPAAGMGLVGASENLVV
nr:unnamed protein product [Digitaria exilis]